MPFCKRSSAIHNKGKKKKNENFNLLPYYQHLPLMTLLLEQSLYFGIKFYSYLSNHKIYLFTFLLFIFCGIFEFYIIVPKKITLGLIA